MSQKQKLFYFTWAVSWVVLAVCTSILFVTLSGGPKTLFDVEAWFVTFPVAWTAALLAVRYRACLNAFADRALMKYVYFIAICGFQAWNSWERGVRKDNAGFKMIGIMLAFALALLLIGLVVELVQIYKRQTKSGIS
ncbi:MAG: hypothetical protein V4671_20045 [Armatimonadota bacterium]